MTPILNTKNIIILLLIIIISYIILYNIFSLKEGLKIKKIKAPKIKAPKLDIGKEIKNVGKQIEKGASKAAEEAKKAAENAKKVAEEQAKKVAEEAKKAAEMAAKALEELNILKAFEKLFGAFGSLEKIFTKFPSQISSLFKDATDFKANTIKGLQNI